MREIKFRAWDKEIKKMVNPFGNSNGDITFLNFLIEDIQNNFNGRLKLMQFTGLKDKNGKEIYEGDIVDRLFVFLSGSFIEHLGKTKPVVIIFNSGHFGYDNGFGNPLPIITERTEVIGNIYENPELLERSSTITN